MCEDALRGAHRTFVQHIHSIDNHESNDTDETGLCLRDYFRDVTAVRRLTRQDTTICTRRNAESGAYPIHLAVGGGSAEVVEHLLELAPSSVRFQTIEGVLPIHLASHYGHKQISSLLFNLDPSTLTAQTHHGLTAEDIAHQSGHGQLTEILQCAVSYMDCSTVAIQDTYSMAPEGTQATQFMPAVQIPSPQQLAEASYDSVNNGITTSVDLSQLLLDEFHRASLLEIEEEPELSPPTPGMMRYEKFPRMVPSRGSPRGGAAPNSLLLNLSDELATAQQAQRHSQRGAHADKLLMQGLAGQPLPVPSTSPFLFQPVMSKAPPRAGTAKGCARPRTAGAEPLLRASTAQTAQTRSGRPPSATSAHPILITGAAQVQRTVQVQMESTVPALVITSAAVQRLSKDSQGSREAQHTGTVAAAGTPSNDPPVSHPGSATSPVVTLRKPPSRPSSPRASSLPLRAYSGTRGPVSKSSLKPATHKVASPGRDAKDGNEDPLSAEGQSLPCPESPRQQKVKKVIIKSPAPSNLQFVKYALESRRLEPTASPPRDSTAASDAAPTSAEKAAIISQEKVLAPRPYVHTVNLHTIVPDLPASNHPEIYHGSPLYASHRAFAPPRALRPSSRAGPTSAASATAALAQQSPAARRRLDLDRMAEEAARIAEDSTFVPSPRPLPRVYPSGGDSAVKLGASQRDLTNSLASRAHRLEMLMLQGKGPDEAAGLQ